MRSLLEQRLFEVLLAVPVGEEGVAPIHRHAGTLKPVVVVVLVEHLGRLFVHDAKDVWRDEWRVERELRERGLEDD